MNHVHFELGASLSTMFRVVAPSAFLVGMMTFAVGCVGTADEATAVSEEALSLRADCAPRAPASKPLYGHVIASGIPGAAAITQVGQFLAGGPIHDKPALAALTQPGRVLDPTRLLVGSTSNFGAPKANADQAEGAYVSIDPTGAKRLDVPTRFAAAGDQATTLAGAVQLYTAQSPNFINGKYNPAAVTASQAAVSNPLAIAINNGFGRVWSANAPYGLGAPGTSSIDDPDGRPLAGAPNLLTGGVYFDDLTGRKPTQVAPGSLAFGAVGTAFLGASPDGSTRAVFAVVTADGSIVQEHTGKGLDGLAPPGTLQSLLGQHGLASDDDDDDDDRRFGGHGHDGHHHGHHDGRDEHAPSLRAGAIVSRSPSITLFVSQPRDRSIKAISLAIGGPAGSEAYVATSSRVIRSAALDEPVDLAPVRVDATDHIWAANTTMEAGSDFYVCNRGNNTIVRMKQDGTVVAVRDVRVDGHALGSARINGIAASPDRARVWVTYTGRLPGQSDRLGGVIQVPAF